MISSASQGGLQIPDAHASASPVPYAQRTASPSRGAQSGIVVFSGGSAANNLVDVFEHVRGANGCPLSYVIPISDNGGSTSEIIRVFGGPGVCDMSRGRGETAIG